MEEKKVTLEKVVQRIDQLLNILEMISGDLQEISQSLKALSGQTTLLAPAATPTPTPPSTTTPAPASAPVPAPSPVPSRPEKLRSIEDIKILFPEDLENMLRFEEKNGDIIIKPRQFLGSENFAKIASIVRGVGGEYISAGKESHFRIPRAM